MDGNLVLKAYKAINEVIGENGLEKLQLLSGIGGITARDIIGTKGLSKFIIYFKKKLPNGIKSEIQQEIFTDSLVELQDYIKNSRNLDNGVLDQMIKVMVNGISDEEILTRTYLSTLKELTLVDMKVMKLSQTIEIEGRKIDKSKYTDLIGELTKEKELDGYPEELLKISLEKLVSYGLVLELGKMSRKAKESYKCFKSHKSFFAMKIIDYCSLKD